MSLKLLVAALAVVVVGTTSLAAQPPAQSGQPSGQRPGGPGRGRPPVDDAAGISPAEIAGMFDAYALLQAQEQLHVRDDQYSQFLLRFKTLQEVRRRSQQERQRMIMQLQRVINQGQADEMQLRDRLRALQELEARSIAEIRKADDAVDQVLDVQQQATFRVFEELMERRKIELLTRARQANRRPPPQQ